MLGSDHLGLRINGGCSTPINLLEESPFSATSALYRTVARNFRDSDPRMSWMGGKRTSGMLAERSLPRDHRTVFFVETTADANEAVPLQNAL